MPTDGNPLRGLIQDHVVTGVMITMKDTFLTREEYQNLVYGALKDEKGNERVLLMTPAIIKPVPRWTGKQVISTVLKNLLRGKAKFNLNSNAKIPARMWPTAAEESVCIFYESELVMGVIDKAQYGATAYGLVHCCYELYGAQIAGQLLSILGRLFNKYLLVVGFTCRMDDLLLKVICSPFLVGSRGQEEKGIYRRRQRGWSKSSGRVLEDASRSPWIKTRTKRIRENGEKR